MAGGGWAIPPTDAVLNRISQEFKVEDIVEATAHFSQENRLGEGTYGTVFRGCLRDGTEVAIKTLTQPKEGGFREEVEVLSKFRHPNLVILLGFARNGKERYLVYELLAGGDMYARLAKDAGFRWKERLNVLLDSALGLSHLHGSQPQVFHRDVKTQNILMDKNGTGKVADFGLACLAQQHQKSLTVSQTSGTIGYADPLYIRTGVVTEGSEVYSFGMVMLETLTGRPPALQHPSGRIEYQFEHIRGDMSRVLPMVDPRGAWPEQIRDALGRLALRCISEQERDRPPFIEIVKEHRRWLRTESMHGPPVRRPSPAADGGIGGAAPRPAAAQFEPQGGGGGYAHAAPRPAPAAGGGYAQAAPRPAAAQFEPQGAPLGAAFEPVREPWPGAAPAQAPAAPVPVVPATEYFKEEDVQQLMGMGFSRYQVLEAFKRCSTVEAAAMWIMESMPEGAQ